MACITVLPAILIEVSQCDSQCPGCEEDHPGLQPTNQANSPFPRTDPPPLIDTENCAWYLFRPTRHREFRRLFTVRQVTGRPNAFVFRPRKESAGLCLALHVFFPSPWIEVTLKAVRPVIIRRMARSLVVPIVWPTWNRMIRIVVHINWAERRDPIAGHPSRFRPPRPLWNSTWDWKYPLVRLHHPETWPSPWFRSSLSVPGS